MNPKNKITIFSLFLLIIIDTMGISVVFPVFAPLFFGHNSILSNAHLSTFTVDVIYGTSLCTFPLFMFIGAPLLGQLSDNIGRKKSLLLCLIGTAIGYGVSALGISYVSLFLLIFGRALAGLFAGSQAIAQAAIADISNPETKAFNMGMIVLAYSAGIILGPVLSGVTSSSTLYYQFNFATPFMIAALLAIVNALLLLFSFDETYKTKSGKIQVFAGIYLCLSAFKMVKIRLLSVSFVCMVISWSLFFQAIGWRMLQAYQYNSLKIGIFMGFMGIISAISLTVGIKLIFQWLKFPTKVFALCTALMALSNLLLVIIQSQYVVWLLIIPNAFGAAIAYAVALTLFSNTADADSQGLVMGISGSLTAVAWTITALLTGFLGFLHMNAPYFIAGATGLISFAAMLVLWHHSLKPAGKLKMDAYN